MAMGDITAPPPSGPPSASRSVEASVLPISAGRTSPRRLTPLALVVLVAVLLVLATVGLDLVGAIPWLKPSSSAGRSVTFSEARSQADRVVPGYLTGPTTLGAAVGIGATSSFTDPQFGGNGSAPCSAQIFPGFSRDLSVPARSDSPGRGSVPLWLLEYSNASELLVVRVLFGSAEAYARSASGAGCPALASLPATPATLVDSSTAANVTNAHGGTAFLNAYRGASELYWLVPNLEAAIAGGWNATWIVQYTSCLPFAASAANGSTLTVGVNALNSSNVTPSGAGPSTGPCTIGISPGGPGGNGNTPIGEVLALGAPLVQFSGSTYWTNVTVGSAGGGIQWDEVELQVKSAGGAIVAPTSAWLGVVTTAGGAPVASYQFANGIRRASAPPTVVSGDRLSIQTPTSLSGDMLVITGLPPFQGSILVSIP